MMEGKRREEVEEEEISKQCMLPQTEQIAAKKPGKEDWRRERESVG
jgi:hypothetical protein